MVSFDDTDADAVAGRFFGFIDGDDGGDFFARIFFSTTGFTSVFVSCTTNKDDGDSCFTIVGLMSTSNTNPKRVKFNSNQENVHCHLGNCINIKI